MSNFRIPFLNNCLTFVRRSFPEHCVLCGAEAHDIALCPACRAELPRPGDAVCPVCAHPTAGGEVCGPCLRERPAFAGIHSALVYRFPADRLVQGLKFGNRFSHARVLGALLVDSVAAQPHPDLIVPMPLHSARLRVRGFNQTQEIARHVAGTLKIRLDSDICWRVKDTSPQVGLKSEARRRNVRKAFASRPVDGACIAVVDDVATSGATLNSLAQTLLDAGAKEVWGWVAARAVRDDAAISPTPE